MPNDSPISVFDHEPSIGGVGEDDTPYDVGEVNPDDEARELTHCAEDFDPQALESLLAAGAPRTAVKPRVIKTIRGMGKIYDFRTTGLLAPSGGLIRPLIMVEHIPVVPNMPGIGDFLALARVLNAQNLSLQAATDTEGHVALYTPLNRLCWQARGANSISCGVEHMHMSINEDWSKKQLRASAWLWQYAEREFGIPLRVAKIGDGPGATVSVFKRGHTSHKRVAAAAGFNDRSDPGGKYDWEYVRAAVLFFKRHGHFEGA